jgi:hypothetical protein
MHPYKHNAPGHSAGGFLLCCWESGPMRAILRRLFVNNLCKYFDRGFLLARVGKNLFYPIYECRDKHGI